MDRRQFLQQSSVAAAGTAAGTTILTNPASVKASPANDKINLAIVGCRGRGYQLMQDFLKRGDCEVGYICDVQSNLFESRGATAESLQGRKPTCVQDFRRALDDSSVDAIIVATPDHWHAPATVWGCQAGKDVYVEKPASHSCWEGKKMVEAARKYECVVQVGTQNRSAPYNMEAKKFIEEGGLGRIHLCKVYNMKMWGNPQWAAPSEAPESLDWDMWLGPADMRDYNATFVTSGWHHMWDFSGGDLANDGVHQVDLARWLVGVELPNKVHCSGSRFDSTGAADSPDTQIATLEYDDMLMTFEVTQYTPYMLKTDPVVRNTDMYPYWLQNATRIEIYGTDGMMIVGRHGGGWQTFIRPSNRQPVVRGESYGRFPDPEHKENFFQCIRNRELPNADVEKGHRSALLVHYSNISMRVGGRDLTIDPATEAFVDDAEANALFKRSYRAPWEIKEEV
jgi:predicted dehydrogenase